MVKPRVRLNFCFWNVIHNIDFKQKLQRKYESYLNTMKKILYYFKNFILFPIQHIFKKLNAFSQKIYNPTIMLRFARIWSYYITKTTIVEEGSEVIGKTKETTYFFCELKTVFSLKTEWKLGKVQGFFNKYFP